MKAVVFLGPSLPLAEARDILEAVYLPPAKQADIISAVRIHEPDVVGLIDGEFGQSLSVWHKEILDTLQRGIPVFGASSMGALRAAETQAYGMVGIGRVFEMYATGECNDDDEVALAHGPEETGYLGLSLPMVNVRATLEHVHAQGLIDAVVRDRLLRVAKAMYFPDRTWSLIFREAESDLLGKVPEAIRQAVEANYVDVKRDDAINLLRHVRDLEDPVPPPQATFDFNRSHLFETLYNRDRRVRHNGFEVPLAAIGSYAALHHPDYNAVYFSALNRALANVLAEVLEVDATEEQVTEEAERFRLRQRVHRDEDLAAWLQRNDLDEAEFDQLMRELARCRILHRWLATRKFMERTTRILVDELRLRGEYEEVAAAAARQERILAENHQFFTETSYHDLRTRQLVIDHLRTTRCRMDAFYKTWAEDAGFHTYRDMRVELLRARLAREFEASTIDQVLTALAPFNGQSSNGQRNDPNPQAQA